MKFTQKLLAFIIVLSTVVSVFVLPVHAARDPYITFTAVSYDSYEQDSSKITFASDRVGTISSGDWLCFKGLDFGENGAYKVDITTAHPSGHGSAIRLRLDDPKGEIFVDVPYVTSNYSDPVISSANITKKVKGVHDLYVSSADKNLNFLNITFYEREAVGGFVYEPYAGGSAFSDLEGYACAEAVNMLFDLGVIPKEEDGLYRPDVETSRGEFAYSIFRLYEKPEEDADEENAKSIATVFADVEPQSEYAEAIDFLSRMGIMNGVSATEFAPYSYITYEDAVIVSMRVLGYTEIANVYGGYSTGYMKTASRLKLGTHITTNDGYLSKGNMAILLENLLNEDCLTASSVAYDSIQLTKNDGILANTQNVYKSRGIVKATAATSINMPDSGLLEDEVLIGDVVYKTGTIAVGGLLGYKCDFWYEENDSERVLRAITPQASTEYFTLSTMDGDEIYTITDKLIQYVPVGEDKQQEIKITGDTSVIYNGVAIDKSLTALMDYENNFKGTITYVSNSDGSEVLFVDEYTDCFVESINAETLAMSVRGSSEKIPLDSEKNLVSIRDTDGNSKRPMQLKTGDIITVYQSKNTKGPKVIRIYAGSADVSGMATWVENDTIYIDSVPYRKSNLWSYEGSVVGEYGVFTLNMYGDVVKIDFSATQSPVSGMFWEYALANTGAFGTGEVQLKLVAEDSQIHIYPLAESVTYNGRRFKNAADIVTTTACRGLSELEQEEIIRYRLNTANQVVMIDTCDSLDGGASDSLCQLPTSGAYKWDTSTGILSSSTSYRGEYYFAPTSFVYNMFANTDTTIDDAASARATLCDVKAAGSSILTNEDITMSAGSIKLYSFDGEGYLVDLLVFDRTTEGIEWGHHQLIDKVYTTVDSEGSACYAISAIGENGKSYTYKLTEEEVAYQSDIDLLSKAQPGDIIRTREHKSKLIDVHYMFLNDGAASRGAITPKVSKTTTSSGSKKNRGIYGTVVDKGDTYLVLKTGEDANGNDILDLVGSAAVVNQVEQGRGSHVVSGNKNMLNISVGDNVYVALRSGNVSQIVIYSNNN